MRAEAHGPQAPDHAPRHPRAARATAREWRASLVVGALFFLIGHGGLHWAERSVPSGLAAVLVATEPIWIALLAAAFPGGRRVSGRTAAGLALGLVGVALLIRSETLSASPELLLGSLAVLAGAFSWSVGILYSRGDRLPADPILRAGTTLLAGAALLLAASALAGEPAALAAARPSARALASLGYLIVFGSLVTYTAYLWLLERCSPTLVATHTYANPAVAVFLGWAAAGEPVTLRLLAAGALILLAILLVGAGERGADRREAVTDTERRAANA